MEDRDKIIGFIEKQKEAAATMKDASAEINIIAINAAIESGHVASGIRIMMEKILDTQMTSNCRLLANVLAARVLLSTSRKSLNMQGGSMWMKYISQMQMRSLSVRISKQLMAGVSRMIRRRRLMFFRKLITQKDGVITQSIQIRNIDKMMFKFVGVPRIDQPGIVQIGYKAESVTQYQSEIGAVFGVLADAISTLGGKVTKLSKGKLDSVLELEKGLSAE